MSKKNGPISWQDEAIGFMVNNDLIKLSNTHIILSVTKNSNVFANNPPTGLK